MNTVTTRAGELAFQERGAGPPVLLLHATLHDHRDFDPVVEQLAQRYRTIALDWPAHGDSPAPAPPLQPSAPLFADVLEDAVNALELSRSVIIGNSVGGFAAARLAITAPERVAGLVLVANGGFIPQTLATRAFCRLMGTPALARRILPASIRSYMKARTRSDREILERAVARAKTREGASVSAGLWRSFSTPDHDLRPRAGELRTPTLLVWGSKDTAIPPRVARETQQAIAGSRLEMLDTGHVVFSSDPERFLELTIPFIEAAIGDPAVPVS